MSRLSEFQVVFSPQDFQIDLKVSKAAILSPNPEKPLEFNSALPLSLQIHATLDNLSQNSGLLIKVCSPFLFFFSFLIKKKKKKVVYPDGSIEYNPIQASQHIKPRSFLSYDLHFPISIRLHNSRHWTGLFS